VILKPHHFPLLSISAFAAEAPVAVRIVCRKAGKLWIAELGEGVGRSVGGDGEGRGEGRRKGERGKGRRLGKGDRARSFLLSFFYDLRNAKLFYLHG